MSYFSECGDSAPENVELQCKESPYLNEHCDKDKAVNVYQFFFSAVEYQTRQQRKIVVMWCKSRLCCTVPNDAVLNETTFNDLCCSFFMHDMQSASTT